MTLVERFIASADDALRDALGSVADLTLRLDEMIAVGQSEWPELALPNEVFVTYIAERLPADRDVVETLSAVRASDLYLACACAQGDAGAVESFDERYMRDMAAVLSRMRLPAASIDEVKQLVRQKLFVAEPGKRARIADYSGRSGLRRWLRSVAVRTCLNYMRKGKREKLVEDDQVFVRVAAAGDDPEVAYMKERYRSEFRQAFLDALGSISPREQSLLRYHYVDQLNIDEIGTIYRVHRVTAYRWLEKARGVLVGRTGELLRDRLKVEDQEYESILRMIQSELHLSLARHLGEREPE